MCPDSSVKDNLNSGMNIIYIWTGKNGVRNFTIFMNINLSRFPFVNGNLDIGFFQIYFSYILRELQKNSDLQIGI